MLTLKNYLKIRDEYLMRKIMLTIILLIAMVTFITAFAKAVESNMNKERLLQSSLDIDLYDN